MTGLTSEIKKFCSLLNSIVTSEYFGFAFLPVINNFYHILLISILFLSFVMFYKIDKDILIYVFIISM